MYECEWSSSWTDSLLPVDERQAAGWWLPGPGISLLFSWGVEGRALHFALAPLISLNHPFQTFTCSPVYLAAFFFHMQLPFAH